MDASRSLSATPIGVPSGAWRWAAIGFGLLAFAAAVIAVVMPQTGVAGFAVLIGIALISLFLIYAIWPRGSRATQDALRVAEAAAKANVAWAITGEGGAVLDCNAVYRRMAGVGELESPPPPELALAGEPSAAVLYRLSRDAAEGRAREETFQVVPGLEIVAAVRPLPDKQAAWWFTPRLAASTSPQPVLTRAAAVAPAPAVSAPEPAPAPVIAAPANAGDGQMVEELLDDLTNPTGDATDDHDDDPSGGAPTSKLTVYGDCAYSGGENLDYYEQSGLEIRTRIQPSHNNSGRFGKDLFEINLEAGTVTCPSGITVELAGHATKSRTAHFGTACQSCPLLNSCTTSENGRTISVGPYERQLQGARQRQQDPDWIADYQATRPKVERKIAHLVRRLHGGRKARVRGLDRVNQDWSLKAGAININRLAKLGVRNISGQWVIQPA